MSTSEVSILLATGRRLHYRRGAHESEAEFSGRLLCAIEEKITGKRGPTPKGTRWVEWHHTGHHLDTFHVGGIAMARESTGNPYQDRTILLPGAFHDLASARKLLGLE